jgi:MSHA biogenesis protein MshE
MYTHFKVPFLDIKHYEFDSEIVRIIPEEMSREHKVIAIDNLNHILTVGMVHSEDKNLIAFLEQETKMMVLPFQIALSDFMEVIESAYIEKEKSVNYVG